MLLLSRWPENEVEPREALTPRAKAIKDDENHPLRIFYVKAPTHWDADTSESEKCALLARRNLASLRMLGIVVSAKNWIKRVFLEWVAVAVGAEERRDRKIKRCVSRRKEFFTPGRLDRGCRLHIDRQPTKHTTIAWADPSLEVTPRSHEFMLRRSRSFPTSAMLSSWAEDNDDTPRRGVPNVVRAPVPDPPVIPPKVQHMLHMMHTPLS